MAFRRSTKIRATDEIYPEMSRAYDVFNTKLFAELLPPCLVTLTRSKSSLGYFSPLRFARHDAQVTHEISMNPAYFASRTTKDTLSTLAHEMVHLWQFVFASPSEGGYHNREFSRMMKAIGLMPSTTGRPGGAEVGVRMDHYVIDDGLFDRACDDLIADGFRLSWVDRFPAEVPLGLDLAPDYTPPTMTDLANPLPAVAAAAPTATIASIRDVLSGDAPAKVVRTPPPILPEPNLSGAATVLSWPSDRQPKGIKAKYRCPCCKFQVWGASGGDLQCNRCNRPMGEVNEPSRSRVPRSMDRTATVRAAATSKPRPKKSS